MNQDLEIRLVDDAAEMHRIATVFDQVWGAATPLINVELARAISHAGGYVAAAYADGQVVGGSIGFLARHHGAAALHSHLTGVLPGVRGTGVGARLKQHQRAWAADQGLAWVTWTFDPLVRRNARFNLRVLGAEVDDYLVNFYGPIDDAINARDESDRLLVAWSTTDDAASQGEEPPSDTIAVPTPDDIVTLRRTDRSAADGWRRRLRSELGDRLAAGGRVVSFSEGGEYLVASAP